jgi:hypothetical protein
MSIDTFVVREFVIAVDFRICGWRTSLDQVKLITPFTSVVAEPGREIGDRNGEAHTAPLGFIA